MLRKVYRLSETFKGVIVKPAYRASKIPPPKNPTMTESFGSKLSEDEMKIIMDPRGYLDSEEKQLAQTPIVIAADVSQQDTKTEEPVVNGAKLQPEYGFKYQGPEPTRYGDWCLKGKCVDF